MSVYLDFFIGELALVHTIAPWLSISRTVGGSELPSISLMRLRMHCMSRYVLLAPMYSASLVLVTTVRMHLEHHRMTQPP